MPSRLRWAALVVLSRGIACGDGGAPLFRTDTRDLTITMFESPAPVSAGPANLSVFVQERKGLNPVLDADVSLRLRAVASGVEVLARLTRGQAPNKLLYGAPVMLTESGKWDMSVTVIRKGDRTEATGTMEVAPTSGKASSYRNYLAFPPLTITAFALREMLIRRRARG
jgi:hypothetical protein